MQEYAEGDLVGFIASIYLHKVIHIITIIVYITHQLHLFHVSSKEAFQRSIHEKKKSLKILLQQFI